MNLNNEKIKFLSDKNNNSYSVDPPTTYLTFAYWIYMVPQYKPESVLILGHALGTVAKLIKLIWGDVPITAVDIVDCPPIDGVTFVKADAKEYVKTCKVFDTVIVDLFNNDNNEPCDFVTDVDFVKSLIQISYYLIVNGLHSDMSVFSPLRRVGINKPSGSAESIYYYEVGKPIPNLHPFK